VPATLLPNIPPKEEVVNGGGPPPRLGPPMPLLVEAPNMDCCPKLGDCPN
jgi:hypothetical protein